MRIGLFVRCLADVTSRPVARGTTELLRGRTARPPVEAGWII
jgi:hypothetical protein